MAIATIIGATAASGGYQAYQARESRQLQKKSAREQRRAAELEQRKAELQNARQRRRARAQQRIEQARVQAASTAREDTTTGTQTTLGALQSQTASNISFQQQLSGLSNQIINYQNSANRYATGASERQARAALPGQLGLSPGSFIGMIPNFMGSGPGTNTLSFSQANPLSSTGYNARAARQTPIA